MLSRQSFKLFKLFTIAWKLRTQFSEKLFFGTKDADTREISSIILAFFKKRRSGTFLALVVHEIQNDVLNLCY